MVEDLNDEVDEDDFFKPSVFRAPFPSHSMSSLPQNASRKDLSIRIHSLIPISLSDINREDLENIILADSTVASASFNWSD